ncbi:MAG: MMPL family transporter [Clostridia bacterium]|nr:MMPL family transporter [Clostridia bacterium]
MEQVAAWIVRFRYLILALAAVACVFAALSLDKVKVNDDLTAFLPPETETRRGLTIMEEEFVTYGTANIMVGNVTYERALELSETLRDMPHVTDVTFDDSEAHYADASALFSISFDGEENDPETVAAYQAVKEKLAAYDLYVQSDIGANRSAQIQAEMGGVLLLAVLVIVAVLLFTSRSYFEVVIFAIVFAVAGLLNMGTNYWLGEISSITNSIAIILQLVLAIDYAIIFVHRYQDATADAATERAAVERSLAESIVEISSSSLTTVSGLIALTLMQFRLGYDLGIVLTKGIVFSMLTVFLVMPALILLFPKQLKRTQHKNLVPDISAWGRILMKMRGGFAILFAVLIPFSIYASSKTAYAFDESTIDELVYSESRTAMHKIENTFHNATVIALMVPSGDYESEKAIIRTLREEDKVASVTGLAGIESETDHVLTDNYTPRMFSLLLDIDYEEARLLYQAYGWEHDEYRAILGNAERYEVPLLDIFLYLFEKIDQGAITLDGDAADKVDDLRGELERGVAQLRGNAYDRIVVTADVPVEGEESVALVDQIRAVGQSYYPNGNVLVTGNITSARDLADSYNSDSLKISFLTILFVFVVLLLTFKSFAGTALLVFVIQGSIWMNFSFPYLQGSTPSFVTYMIVSAIQMGATIDYAIVLINRYEELRKTYAVKEAMVHAISECFPTILTSGSIMSVAGLLIAYRVSDVYIGHIGLTVGRGAIISVILVLTVLPQLITLLDKWIFKTKFEIKLPKIDAMIAARETQAEEENTAEQAKDLKKEEAPCEV